AFFETGIGKIPKKFDLASGSMAGLGMLKDRTTSEIANAAMAIDELFEYGVIRVSAALRILHTKGAEAKIPNAERLRARSSELVQIAQTVEKSLAKPRAAEAAAQAS